MSNDLASNLIEINESMDLLESQTNVTASSNVTKLQEKVDKLETEQLPSLKKDRTKTQV